jgi:predicted NodU family carbamoyl transferase
LLGNASDRAREASLCVSREVALNSVAIWRIAVVEDKRHVIPAGTHVDGSGRLQTVRESDNPNLHALIDRFHALTAVPVLLSAPFKVTNEPIVEPRTTRSAASSRRGSTRCSWAIAC